MKVFAPKTAYRAKEDGTWSGIAADIRSLPDQEAVEAWRYEFTVRGHRNLPSYWQEAIADLLSDRSAELMNAGMDAEYRDIMG